MPFGTCQAHARQHRSRLEIESCVVGGGRDQAKCVFLKVARRVDRPVRYRIASSDGRRQIVNASPTHCFPTTLGGVFARRGSVR